MNKIKKIIAEVVGTLFYAAIIVIVAKLISLSISYLFTIHFSYYQGLSIITLLVIAKLFQFFWYNFLPKKVNK